MSTVDPNDDTLVGIDPVEYLPPNHDTVVNSSDVYYERRHVKWLLKRRFSCLLVGFLLVCTYGIFVYSVIMLGVSLSILVLATLFLLLGIACCWFAWKRYDKVWELRPLEYRVEDGIFYVHQAGVLLPWLMTHSEPEPYNLDEVMFSTPKQTYWEQLIPHWHNSAPVEIKANDDTVLYKLKDMKDVKRVLELHRRHESMTIEQARARQDLDKQQVELLHEQVDLSREILVVLGDIRDRLLHHEASVSLDKD